MPTDLEQSIFRTVAFFSLFEYPLTSFEIWKWLAKPASSYRLEDVLTTLNSSPWLHDRLDYAGGLFVLTGQSALVAVRHERALDSLRKFRRLRRACHYLAFLPMVKMLAVCNTTAWMNTRISSDIDLFVVTKPGRVWITRALVTLPFALLGMRPRLGAKDPFCFSFFASVDALDFRGLRLGREDWYLAQWVLSLIPVADRGTAENFSHLNRWAHGLFPNSFAVRPASYRRFTMWQRHFDIAFIFETLARRVQMARLPKEIAVLANRDSRVVVNQQMIKFHPNDRRQEFADKLEALVR